MRIRSNAAKRGIEVLHDAEKNMGKTIPEPVAAPGTRAASISCPECGGPIVPVNDAKSCASCDRIDAMEFLSDEAAKSQQAILHNRGTDRLGNAIQSDRDGAFPEDSKSTTADDKPVGGMRSPGEHSFLRKDFHGSNNDQQPHS